MFAAIRDNVYLLSWDNNYFIHILRFTVVSILDDKMHTILVLFYRYMKAG